MIAPGNQLQVGHHDQIGIIRCRHLTLEVGVFQRHILQFLWKIPFFQNHRANTRVQLINHIVQHDAADLDILILHITQNRQNTDQVHQASQRCLIRLQAGVMLRQNMAHARHFGAGLPGGTQALVDHI